MPVARKPAEGRCLPMTVRDRVQPVQAGGCSGGAREHQSWRGPSAFRLKQRLRNNVYRAPIKLFMLQAQ
jgi:hypothetical protein